MDSLEELGAEGLIPVDLMPRVVHEYDQVVARVVRGATQSYTLTGHVSFYRSGNLPTLFTSHYPAIEMSNLSFLGF